MDLAKLNIDYLSMAAHKFNGPKGVGALLTSKKAPLYPMIFGGGQEHSFRAGTENVPGIYAMAMALDDHSRHIRRNTKKTKELMERLLAGLHDIQGITFNTDMENRLPGTINVSFENIRGSGLHFKSNKRKCCFFEKIFMINTERVLLEIAWEEYNEEKVMERFVILPGLWFCGGDSMELKGTARLVAMQAKSVEELLELAKEYDRPISKEEAEEIYAELNKEGELADEELEDVAGGACYSKDPHGMLIVTSFNKCRLYEKHPFDKGIGFREHNCTNCMHYTKEAGSLTSYCTKRTRYNDPVGGKATITGPSHDYGPSGPVIQPMK